MIRHWEAQDIVETVRGVGKDSLARSTIAIRAIVALSRCARWKRPACWLLGHLRPVLIPIGGPSANWWNICPRCGKRHSFRGESFLPLRWP